MFFAEITQEARDLGTMGSQALLGVGVIALSTVVVVLFRMWRSDMKEKRQEFEQELRTGRDEFLGSLKDARADHLGSLKDALSAVQAVAAEAKANTAAVQALTLEMKANTAAIIARLDRLESHRSSD